MVDDAYIERTDGLVFGADPLTPDQLPSPFFEPARVPETGLLLSPATLPIVPKAAPSVRSGASR